MRGGSASPVAKSLEKSPLIFETLWVNEVCSAPPDNLSTCLLGRSLRVWLSSNLASSTYPISPHCREKEAHHEVQS